MELPHKGVYEWREKSEMKKLLMLGTCKGSIEMLKTAKKKNIYTIVTDYLPPEQSFGKRIADEY